MQNLKTSSGREKLLQEVSISGTTAAMEMLDLPVDDYDYFILEYRDVKCDTGNSFLTMRLSDDSGATWDGRAGYRHSNIYFNSNGSSLTEDSANTLTYAEMSSEFAYNTGECFGRAIIYPKNGSINHWMTDSVTEISGRYYRECGVSGHDYSGNYTSLQIIPRNSGGTARNLTEGTFKIFGVK